MRSRFTSPAWAAQAAFAKATLVLSLGAAAELVLALSGAISRLRAEEDQT
jgi:hypothetical protein